MLLKELREKVIEIALKAQRERLISLTMGNFSARDRETGYICITPSGMEYDKLAAEDIVLLDAEGNIQDGERKPSIEHPLHCAVYRRRKDVFGVSHTHSVFATAWAACSENIPVVVAELAALVGGPVECAPYKPMGSFELAETAAAYLKDRHAILLANHGVLAVGHDIEAAFANSVVVEEGAKIAYYARQIGVMRIIPEDECRSLRKSTLEKYGQK
ncbi:MAG TPA: class II aldolase/adducin family protein [Bacillota bacterium]|nr:class II aldolase/adducin family protein [Bacillota bacterium]HQE65758.1 class II aldolase/adducin family protein [Bacillota bacterium]HQI16522.1 class II aldolase/adducin family protein [Bacillota bacterium]HQJ37688.1 class II aldolase/adducin family protein [Bacillota bacterium]